MRAAIHATGARTGVRRTATTNLPSPLNHTPDEPPRPPQPLAWHPTTTHLPNPIPNPIGLGGRSTTGTTHLPGPNHGRPHGHKHTTIPTHCPLPSPAAVPRRVLVGVLAEPRPRAPGRCRRPLPGRAPTPHTRPPVPDEPRFCFAKAVWR